MEGTPNLSAILATAMQVSSAMACLHEIGVVHGDLSGGAALFQALRLLLMP